MGKRGIIKFFFLLMMSATVALGATVDRYPFASSEQQQQFQGLITQLRCLVCQNQDIADSNADLAKDLRQQVYQMVLTGKTDDDIKQYMTARYGDYILFKPPFAPQTVALWVMPFILLMIGFFIIWRLSSRSRKSA